jgi:hypothetical protein
MTLQLNIVNCLINYGILRSRRLDDVFCLFSQNQKCAQSIQFGPLDKVPNHQQTFQFIIRSGICFLTVQQSWNA